MFAEVKEGSDSHPPEAEDGANHICTMAGRRGTEPAACAAKEVLANLFGVKTAVVIESVSKLLPEEQVIVLDSFEMGQAHMVRILQQKLAFWTQLPFLLAGVVYWDTAKARPIGQQAIDLYEQDCIKNLLFLVLFHAACLIGYRLIVMTSFTTNCP